MEWGDIKAFYTYEDAPLVEHAISRANLTRHERETLDQRIRENRTSESAAEYLFTSDRSIKRRYNSGMEKLDACWGGLPWIPAILENRKNSKFKQ